MKLINYKYDEFRRVNYIIQIINHKKMPDPIGRRGDVYNPSRRQGVEVLHEILNTAERKIQEKWQSLGGGPGAPKVPGLAGIVAAGAGYYREYVTGARIYYSERGTVHVYGAIGERYNQLGAAESWLGWPVKDESQIVDGGSSLKFEHGTIYWWPDTGAIELGNVSVKYSGMYCFSETSYDQGSDSDEPYAIIGVVALQESDARTIRTPIYDDVDSGNSRPDSIELYTGELTGLNLSVLLMEHDDEDNPDKYKEAVKQAVDLAAKGVALAIELIPYGEFLAPIAQTILMAAKPDIADAINDALDLRDDRLDYKTFALSAKDIIKCTRMPAQNWWGIQWHMESPLLTGGGAEYKVYFEIAAV